MSVSLNRGAIAAAIIIFAVLLYASPSQAQSSWGRCENNSDWTKRIAACLAVIQNGDTPERLSVAHYYIAGNLEVSYERYLSKKASDSLKSRGLNPLIRCDPLLLIYSPNVFDVFRGCPQEQPIGEPTTTDVQRVIDEYSAALRYNPGHLDARFRRGRLFWTQKRFIEALADLEIAVPKRLGDHGARFFRGDSYYMTGNFASAIPDFNAVLKNSSVTEELRRTVLIRRAFAYFSTKNFAAAIQDYTAIIEGGGKDWDPFSSRGRSYLAAGKLKEAASDFSRALSLSPDEQARLQIYEMRGGIRRQQKDREGAIEDFSRALKIKGSARIYSTRGELFFELEKYAEARADLTQALKIGLRGTPARARANELRAFAAMRMRDYENAIEDFSSAIEDKPMPHLFYQRGTLYRATGKGQEALADFIKVIADDQAPAPMKLQSHLWSALIFHKRRDVVNAMKSYDYFFSGLPNGDEQARAYGMGIIQRLMRDGYYSGKGQKYDAELRQALANCIASEQCDL